MNTTAKIRRHISALKPDKIFTTRELLHYGTRAIIDAVLWRMVHIGEIVRLAWGTFVKSKEAAARITPQEIASKKAKAFGRKLIRHDSDVAHQLGLSTQGNSVLSYCTDGATSQFRLVQHQGRFVRFRHTSKRRFRLRDTAVGSAIRGLWTVGPSAACKVKSIEKATQNFGASERKEFRACSRWMPSWLSDYVCLLYMPRPHSQSQQSRTKQSSA